MRILLDLLEGLDEFTPGQDRYDMHVRQELLAMSPATIVR